MINEQERWLLPLLLASKQATTEPEQFPLDRIRLQKAVFLLGRGSARWAELYAYRPYNWGPYSSELNQDADELISRGLLKVAPALGSRHGSYALTAAGEAIAVKCWNTLSSAEQRFIRATREFVTGRSFNTLLREVYSAFPEFATESLFKQ